MSTDLRLIVVGESNPYGAAPAHALYPLPPGCAGARLREVVMGLPLRDYLRLERVNLSGEPFSRITAQRNAYRLAESAGSAAVFILLGRRVAHAFRVAGLRTAVAPFERTSVRNEAGVLLTFAALPHPSGRCREWNAPGSIERARHLLRSVAPWVPWGSEP